MARLLVAEDDHLMRWSLEKFLTRQGHAVRSVDSGKAAMDAAGLEDYRAVIINHMWEADDFHFVWRIKSRSPQTHVIVLTARTTPQTERLARDTGAFDFLEKPFSLLDLKQAVDRAITTPERRKGPRGCCGGCEWRSPCGRWQ
ncbi:MAG TPA: response regulator [Candidatus Methylomirabilis sp.]|nr:response regulator [Candidatus Methylomirabilis sp.]